MLHGLIHVLMIGILCSVSVFGLIPEPADAADVRQVRSGTQLVVGDSNRSYTVELACIEVPPDQQDAAIVWMRQMVPRGTRVNLRPMGQEQGILLARVTSVGRGGQVIDDLGASLLRAGFAIPSISPGAEDCAALSSEVKTSP